MRLRGAEFYPRRGQLGLGSGERILYARLQAQGDRLFALERIASGF